MLKSNFIIVGKLDDLDREFLAQWQGDPSYALSVPTLRDRTVRLCVREVTPKSVMPKNC
jgi:hypothetical protein